MNDNTNKFILEQTASQTETNALLDRLFDVARPEAIFGKPVTSGERTVITASEAIVSMGAGYGGGGGYDADEAGPGGKPELGFGGGGGGGGFSMGRPSAAIIIEPNGVRVEPIVDVTKVAIAFFTTFAAMLISLMRLRRTQRELERFGE